MLDKEAFYLKADDAFREGLGDYKSIDGDDALNQSIIEIFKSGFIIGFANSYWQLGLITHDLYAQVIDDQTVKAEGLR